MKIHIIGPEGSGKTILTAMLNHYIERHYTNGFKFRASSFNTKLYFTEILNILNEGEWPPSTKQGQPKVLNWQWETDDGIIIDVNMHDIAGQDFRMGICNEDSNELKSDIKKSDLIIAVCDLFVHPISNDVEVKAGNAWIIEWLFNYLTKKQKMIIVLTKFDMFKDELPVQKWHDKQELLKLINEYMPEFNTKGYNLDNCFICAVSAVSVQPVSTKDHTLERFPGLPLESKGMENLLSEIKRIVYEKNTSIPFKIVKAKNNIKTMMNQVTEVMRPAIEALGNFINNLSEKEK